MSITIMVVDDHHIVRQGIISLINNETEMKVVGEAADGRMAVELAKKILPTIILMDITMPALNGIEATRQICNHNPNIKVIGLSQHCNNLFIRDMLTAGAKGYVLKSDKWGELVTAIQTVMGGKSFVSLKVAEIVLDDYIQEIAQQKFAKKDGLTFREIEILQLLAEGKSTKEIAQNCFLSTNTVDSHRKHIMEKLHTHSIAGLTKYAIRQGLTPLEA